MCRWPFIAYNVALEHWNSDNSITANPGYLYQHIHMQRPGNMLLGLERLCGKSVGTLVNDVTHMATTQFPWK